MDARIKIKLTNPVKLEGKWCNPNDFVYVSKEIAGEILLNKAGSLVDSEKKEIKSQSMPESKTKEEIINDLCALDGINDDLAENLYENGFTSISKVSNTCIEDLVLVKGIGSKSAKKIIESAIILAD